MRRRPEAPIRRVNPSGKVMWLARYTGRDGRRRVAKPPWNGGKGTFGASTRRRPRSTGCTNRRRRGRPRRSGPTPRPGPTGTRRPPADVAGPGPVDQEAGPHGALPTLHRCADPRSPSGSTRRCCSRALRADLARVDLSPRRLDPGGRRLSRHYPPGGRDLQAVRGAPPGRDPGLGAAIRPHHCRLSWITHLRAAGIDDADLAKVAGHTVETMIGLHACARALARPGPQADPLTPMSHPGHIRAQIPL
jgi:hypothetical protein